MRSGDDSPWSKPKSRQGPRLVDDGSASGVLEPIGAGDHTASPVLPSGAADSSGRSRSTRPARNTLRLAAVVGAVVVLVVVIFVASSLTGGGDMFSIETVARSVVMVASPECDKAGSGTLVSADGLILTNSHVVTEDGRDVCRPIVGLTNGYDEEPTDWYSAVVLVDDPDLDLSVLQILDDDGSAVRIGDRDPIPLDTSIPMLGDQIQTLGYPGIGGQTMTFTSGDFAGVAQLSGVDFYKTTASLNPGVSGGSAFNGSSGLVGVPTAGFGAEVVCEQNDCTSLGDSLGLIRPIRYALPLVEQAKRLTR